MNKNSEEEENKEQEPKEKKKEETTKLKWVLVQMFSCQICYGNIIM